MKLFNHRVGKDVASNPRHFRLDLVPVETAIECELKIFTLADFFQSLASHLLKRTVDRFSLGIQNALLQRDVNISFHGGDYPLYVRTFNMHQTIDLAQPCEPRVQFGESTFKHLAVMRVLNGLQLLKHALT